MKKIDEYREICPIIKDYCCACTMVNGKPFCDVSCSPIERGNTCPDDEEQEEEEEDTLFG